MFKFNWEDLEKKSTREVLNGLMNGKYPLQDTKTKEYYYMQPQKNSNGVADDEKMERIDVPSANSPNPTWQNDTDLNRNVKTTTNEKLFNSAITQDFKDRIGEIESASSGGYKAYTSKGGSMGALGKYQFRKPALQDLGFVDKKGQWTGYKNINSQDDFLASPQVQEMAANDYFRNNAKKLNSCGASGYIGSSLDGVSGKTFPVSAGGLLAASHRMGSGNVCNYVNNLDKKSNGNYFMNYEKVSPDDEEKFRAIETRLRRFAF